MGDVQQTVNLTNSESSAKDAEIEKTQETVVLTPPENEEEADDSNNSDKGENYTDPKVCHDPTIEIEGIIRQWNIQNTTENSDGEDEGAVGTVPVDYKSAEDQTRVEGILYPLITVNNRNVEREEILKMTIDYKGFLPSIYLVIYDPDDNELPEPRPPA